MADAPDNKWFTVTVRTNRDTGVVEFSKPHVKEIEIMNGKFTLRDSDNKDLKTMDVDDIEWYKVKINESFEPEERA